jgi:hypothetical protein
MSSSPEEPDGQTEEGQVSEVANLRQDPAPIAPEDAVAGYPDSESGHPDEGPAGPDAPAKRDRALPDRRWDDD